MNCPHPSKVLLYVRLSRKRRLLNQTGVLMSIGLILSYTGKGCPKHLGMLETEAKRALFHIERCITLCPSTGRERDSLLSAQESMKSFLVGLKDNIGIRDSFDVSGFSRPTSFDLVSLP